jgi:hypothetical protein
VYSTVVGSARPRARSGASSPLDRPISRDPARPRRAGRLADEHDPPKPLAATEGILLRGGWRKELVQVVIHLLDVTRPPARA